MSPEFDYVIVGAGPTGLTLAWILGKYGNKILLVDREASIGGCHRVRRVDGFFTEHGPRIYISNAKTFKTILKSMNMDFDKMFIFEHIFDVPLDYNHPETGQISIFVREIRANPSKRKPYLLYLDI